MSNADHDGCTMQYPCERCVEARKLETPSTKPCCHRLEGGWHCMLDDGHDGDHRSPTPRPIDIKPSTKGKVA